MRCVMMTRPGPDNRQLNFVPPVHAMNQGHHIDEDITLALPCLEFQVAELQALDAAYPGCLKLTGYEARAWQAACLLCGVAEPTLTCTRAALGHGEADEQAGLKELSGTCEVPDVVLQDAAVRLRFSLPHGYPDHTAAQLAVECCASSAAFEALNACVKGVATREAAVGACCLLTALQELKECAEALAAQALDDRQGEPTPAAAAAHLPLVMARQLIWFHHIKSTTKRKIIVSEARGLNLGGASKPGFPGVIVVEGVSGDVKEYTARIRALSWQAMQVRCYEEEQVHVALPPGAATQEQQVQQCRRLPQPFVELPETGLSELAAMCTAAGLADLYKTAMKLS